MKLIQLLSYNLSWKIRPSELQTPLILHLGTKNQTIKVTEIILINNWPKSGCL